MLNTRTATLLLSLLAAPAFAADEYARLSRVVREANITPL